MADCPICVPVCFSFDCQLALGSWPFVFPRSGAAVRWLTAPFGQMADCPLALLSIWLPGGPGQLGLISKIMIDQCPVCIMSCW